MTVYVGLTESEIDELKATGKATFTTPLNPLLILGEGEVDVYTAAVSTDKGMLTLWMSMKREGKHER